MLKQLRLLWNLWPAIKHLVRARRLAWSRDWSGSLMELRGLATRRETPFPSERLPFAATVLVLQGAYWTRDANLAEAAAQTAIRQLNTLQRHEDSPRMRHRADYLFGFCEFCAGRFDERSAEFLELADGLEGAGRTYEIDQVPTIQRNEMPLGQRT